MPASSIPKSSASGSTDVGSQGPLQRFQRWLNSGGARTEPKSTFEQVPTVADSENPNGDAKSKVSNFSAGGHESTSTSAGAYSEEGFDEEGPKYPTEGQAAGYNNPRIYGREARHYRQTVDNEVVQQGSNNRPRDRDVTGAEGGPFRVETPGQIFNNRSVTVLKAHRGTAPTKGSHTSYEMTFNNFKVDHFNNSGSGSN